MKNSLYRFTRKAAVRWLRIIEMNGGGSAPALLRALRGWPAFLRDAAVYRRASDGGAFRIRLSGMLPVLGDRYQSAGTLGHYFHQDLWAARRIHSRGPRIHVDIGSRIDGFVAHLLVFMPVTVIDVRPLASVVAGLAFVQEDATALSSFQDDSIDSLSSLHAVEHFGLGRYGDPVDPGASLKIVSALARVLKPGGRLYFSVPVGRERLEFNAHRVFAPRTIADAFARLRLVSFAGIDDQGALRDPCKLDDLARSDYACGLYEFTKD